MTSDTLRTARLAQHKSLRTVAEAVGVSPAYVCDIERGFRHAPHMRAKIASFLGVPMPDDAWNRFQSGRLPSDIAGMDLSADQVEAGFSAFRQTLEPSHE